MKEHSKEQHDIYVVNLDQKRIFWFLAISLFVVSFAFLLGYWLGSDVNHSSLYETQLKTRDIMPQLNKEELHKIEEIQKPQDNKIEESGADIESTQVVVNKLPAPLVLPEAERIPQQTLQKHSSQVATEKYVLHPQKSYSIQVSSHKVQANAVRFKEKLTKQGFRAYIQVKEFNQTLLYHVRVGTFSDYKHAEKLQKELTQRGIKNTFIMQYAQE